MGFGVHAAIESKWSFPASNDQSRGVVFPGDVRRDSEPDDEDTTLRRAHGALLPFLGTLCMIDTG
jgi:hypothetical protein